MGGTQRLIIKTAFEEENVKSNRKRPRFSKYLELEITVYDWFNRNRAEHPELEFRGQSLLIRLSTYSNFSKIRAILFIIVIVV